MDELRHLKSMCEVTDDDREISGHIFTLAKCGDMELLEKAVSHTRTMSRVIAQLEIDGCLSHMCGDGKIRDSSEIRDLHGDKSH